MKILIVGSGGREFAIARRISQDSGVERIYFAPGNGATGQLGENIDIKDFDELANFAKKNSIDLTIVGPEAPLTDGIVDVFKSKNLRIFGPDKNAAKLEGSKVFMKDFLHRNKIKTAKYLNSSDFNEISKFIETLETPIVVKADGLCASKGGMIAMSKSFAKEAASRNVRFNCVTPGFIETKMTEILNDEIKKTYETNIPLKKFGTPNDVANGVAFLLSDYASYITGEVLKINGGLYM